MITFEVEDKTPELMQKLEAAAGRFVRSAALHIEGAMKASMEEPKSGESYKRGEDGIHVASAPGESPAKDSSNFINSIEIFPEAALIASTLEARIGTVLEYPVYLEEGTDDIERRPLWDETVKNELPTLEARLKREILGV